MTIYPPIQTCFCFVTQSTSNQQRRVTVNGPKERSPPHIDEGGGVEGGGVGGGGVGRARDELEECRRRTGIPI